MTTKIKHLSICILLIGLNACSSKDQPENNSAPENQTTEQAAVLDTAIEKSPVIVSKDKLTPDQSWEKIDREVLGNNSIYFYPVRGESVGYSALKGVTQDLSYPTDHEKIKNQLHLDKNQLVVIGIYGGNSENNMLLNLSNDEYFKYANNLAINYLRALQVPSVEPKQEFEKTQDYEQRFKQAQQSAKNNLVDYDAELLERVLNHIVPDINFSASETVYEYDADQELMSISLIQRSTTGAAVIRSELLVKVQPNVAKSLAENFNQLKLGYILNTKNNTLNLDGIFFYFIRYGNPDRQSNSSSLYTTSVLKPITFKQKSTVELPWYMNVPETNIETLPFKDILTSPLWQFKFGLENYLSPETLLQKHVKPEIPKEPEEFKNLGEE